MAPTWRTVETSTCPAPAIPGGTVYSLHSRNPGADLWIWTPAVAIRCIARMTAAESSGTWAVPARPAGGHGP